MVRDRHESGTYFEGLLRNCFNVTAGEVLGCAAVYTHKVMVVMFILEFVECRAALEVHGADESRLNEVFKCAVDCHTINRRTGQGAENLVD